MLFLYQSGKRLVYTVGCWSWLQLNHYQATCIELSFSSVYALLVGEMASKPDELVQTDVWNLPCSDNHLVLLSELIVDWKEMGPYLSLTRTDEEDIFTCYPRSAQCQRIEMLRIWSQKNGQHATYKKLAVIFQNCNREDLFSKISELVTSASIKSHEG